MLSLPLRRRALLIPVLLALAGCPKPAPTGDGGTCSGAIGCACSDSQPCTTGSCVSGACVDCRVGDLACACRSNGTCSTGLRCAANVCQTCTAGEASCACGPGDTCNTGLTCTAGVCTSSACVAGAPSCPCRAAAPACDGTAQCQAGLCQACNADQPGCPCAAGNTCSGTLVCDPATTTCRAATTCAMLHADGGCPTNQACTEGAAMMDATCVQGSCVGDFKWDAVSKSCVACVSPGCANEPTCAGTLGTTCAQNNRTCSQTGATASCAACLPGFVDNGTPTCAPTPLCGTAVCGPTEYCDVSTTTCTASPCPAGQAKGATTACAACNISCATAGFSGNVWPFRTATGLCVCETLPGYFLAAGANGQATLCDADNDGWVNQDADSSHDPALLANARCAIRRVDTVRLVDEFGTGLDLRSCVSGMTPQPDPGGPCTNVLPLRLLETPRNDTPGQPMGTLAPGYGTLPDGGAARLLEADELNSLTKACVSANANYNDNATEDINEVALSFTTSNDRLRLEAFAYFVELHTAWYEPPTGAGNGTLVIRERSRCESAFPLHYDPTASNGSDLYSLDAGATWWRSCQRRRDADYLPATQTFDFAKWDCAATTGSCPALPPAHATLSGPLDPKLQLMRQYGLCELDGGAPADGKWRGMTHHSQFKCVNVTSTVRTQSDKLPSDFGTKYVFNRCATHPCAMPGDATCQSPQGDGSLAQTRQPVVDCSAKTTVSTGDVGWAATLYLPYGPATSGYSSPAYQSGCVNEDVETQVLPPTLPSYLTWLCPYPEYDSVYSPRFATQRPKSDTAFGRASCLLDPANFLWGDLATGPERATLRWASSPTDFDAGVFR